VDCPIHPGTDREYIYSLEILGIKLSVQWAHTEQGQITAKKARKLCKT
jgi:hypothetical protein